MLRAEPADLFFDDDGLYRYLEQPFTGVVATTWPDGSPRAEIEHRDGYRWGKLREWYRNGKLAEEAEFRMGVGHGLAREWDQQGVLVMEEQDEYGVMLWRKELGDDGELVEVYRLGVDDPNYSMLEEFRRIHATPTGDIG